MTGQQGVPQVDVPAPGLGALVTEEDVAAAWRMYYADGMRAVLEAYGARLLARTGRNPGYPQVLGGFIAAPASGDLGCDGCRPVGLELVKRRGGGKAWQCGECGYKWRADAARTPHATGQEPETGL